MFLMPAIEWNKQTITGDLPGSSTMTNVADTSGIEVGMVVSNENVFPYNTRVVSKTANSITMDSLPILVGTGFTLDFHNRYEFEYPPTDDEEETSKIQKKVVTSLSGARQTVVDYIEYERRLTFGFITPADRDILKGFYEDFAGRGEKFRYFNDKAINGHVVYEDDDDEFSQERQAKKAGSFLYEISFRFRRVE